MTIHIVKELNTQYFAKPSGQACHF